MKDFQAEDLMNETFVLLATKIMARINRQSDKREDERNFSRKYM